MRTRRSPPEGAAHHGHARRERGRPGRDRLGAADQGRQDGQATTRPSRPASCPQLTAQEVAVMQTVVSQGTAKRAAYGGFAAGKTGTTENYGDAWFIGFTDKLTIAVWVGYPNGNTSMATRLRRRAGRGRDLPRADLARLRGGGQRDSRPARGRPRREDQREARQEGPAATGRHDVDEHGARRARDALEPVHHAGAGADDSGRSHPDARAAASSNNSSRPRLRPAAPPAAAPPRRRRPRRRAAPRGRPAATAARRDASRRRRSAMAGRAPS